MTPLVKKVAFRVGAVDKPDARKVHSRLMPRMGGLAIFLAFTITILLVEPMTKSIVGLLAGGALILFLGIADDIVGVSPRVKLLGQILAAGVLVGFGERIQFITNPFGGDMFQLPIAGIPLTIFWIVGVTNAVNLVDGLDGLAGGLAAIASLTLAVIGWANNEMLIVVPAVILSASICGFLKYNFHPAKIFMGDSGSLFLGYMLAGLSVIGLTKGAAVISVFVPILILGIPIFDTLYAIVRRFINNQPIFEADKGHLHHRLLAIGLSHRQTVVAIYGISGLLGASAIVLTFLTTAQAFIVFVGISLLVLIGANRIGAMSAKVMQRAQTGDRNMMNDKPNIGM
jgi:UDP-GlcNAc:undecaprenyl-phosphate GlcNAc-1-phosphate transferase